MKSPLYALLGVTFICLSTYNMDHKHAEPERTPKKRGRFSGMVLRKKKNSAALDASALVTTPKPLEQADPQPYACDDLYLPNPSTGQLFNRFLKFLETKQVAAEKREAFQQEKELYKRSFDTTIRTSAQTEETEKKILCAVYKGFKRILTFCGQEIKTQEENHHSVMRSLQQNNEQQTIGFQKRIDEQKSLHDAHIKQIQQLYEQQYTQRVQDHEAAAAIVAKESRKVLQFATGVSVVCLGLVAYVVSKSFDKKDALA